MMFFKQFIEAESSEKLLLPRKKMSGIMNEEEDGCAILLGPDGRKWPVVIDKWNGEWSFMEGWKAFLEGNSVVENDLMFFTYVGDMKFSVEIFEPDGIKKSVGCTSKTRRSHRNSAVRAARGTKAANVSEGVGVPSVKQPRGRYHVPTPKEQIVADSFFAFSSGGPFLVRTLVWKYGKFPVLNISHKFLRTHHLTLYRNQEIILRNETGRSWMVKVNKLMRAFAFGAGFPCFLHENHARHGNTLVYEVIDRSSMEMKVHFYR